MKNLIFILLVVLCWFNVNAQFTREQAIEIVATEIVGLDSLDIHHLYSKYEKMEAGDTLWMYYQDEYYLCPYNEQWVFFVDDMSNANWAHPSRIIFFNSNTGDYVISPDHWPPYPFFENPSLFMEQWEWVTTTDISLIERGGLGLKLFPNPCKNMINLKFETILNAPSIITIFDFYGNILSSTNVTDNSEDIYLDISSFETGYYLINVYQNGQLIHKEKFGKIN